MQEARITRIMKILMATLFDTTYYIMFLGAGCSARGAASVLSGTLLVVVLQQKPPGKGEEGGRWLSIEDGYYRLHLSGDLLCVLYWKLYCSLWRKRISFLVAVEKPFVDTLFRGDSDFFGVLMPNIQVPKALRLTAGKT